MNTPARIGRYEIIRRLGKSMTDVYLAMDTLENRKVALKLIPEGIERARQLIVEAERRGAAIQQELHHIDPRMVEIYEYGDLDGYFFVAMQFVEGRTVAEVLASDQVVDPCRGPLDVSCKRARRTVRGKPLEHGIQRVAVNQRRERVEILDRHRRVDECGRR